MLIVDKLALQEGLSEGEKTLARYILAHGMEIAKYSTRSLAEVTYTSPPTVLRLCKKLGFTGFDDFKPRPAAGEGGLQFPVRRK